MEQQTFLDNYLLKENPGIIAKLKDEILANRTGLFLMGEIKNFSFLKNYFSNSIIKSHSHKFAKIKKKSIHKKNYF